MTYSITRWFNRTFTPFGKLLVIAILTAGITSFIAGVYYAYVVMQMRGVI